MLQKHIDRKDYVKIKLSFFGENEDLSGFILDMSKDFLLIQTSGDFSLDGYAIITKYDFDNVKRNDYDETQKKILVAEGIFDEKYGIAKPINLDDWSTILTDLAAQDYHIIAQKLNKKYLAFKIGPIVEILNKKFKIRNYDPNGKLDEKLTTVKYDELKIIKFGDSYSTIFRKYLK